MNAKVTAVRPELTPEERERRMKSVEDAIRKLWIAMERKEAGDAQTEQL